MIIQFNRDQNEGAHGLWIEDAKQFARELFSAGKRYWIQEGANGWNIFPEGTPEWKALDDKS